MCSVGDGHAPPFKRAEFNNFWHRRELGKEGSSDPLRGREHLDWASPAGHWLGQGKESRWEAGVRGTRARERWLGDTQHGARAGGRLSARPEPSTALPAGSRSCHAVRSVHVLTELWSTSRRLRLTDGPGSWWGFPGEAIQRSQAGGQGVCGWPQGEQSEAGQGSVPPRHWATLAPAGG